MTFASLSTRGPDGRSPGVFGEGELADAVAAALARQHGGAGRLRPGDLSDQVVGRPAVVVATDGWDTAPYGEVRSSCRSQRVAWLPVRAELGRVVIGPVEQPGQAGCVRCAELRRDRAQEHASARAQVWARHGARLAQSASSWLTTLAADSVGALVAEEVRRLTLQPSLARTRSAMLFLDLEGLSVVRHPFLADPLCPECGHLPADDPDLARLTLASRPKLTPHTYRVRDVIVELDQLVATYVDGESGLIRGLQRGTQGGLVVAGAMMPLRIPGAVEPGVGRTRSYRQSELVAVLEALERYGGVEPGGKRTVVHGSYAELADRALDVRELGLHPPENYLLPGFHYRPFDEDALCHWVWGYSFARQAPILVPETCAYYYQDLRGHEERPFVYEISNGCALGSGIEEAVLYGLLEVAERDAFLLTWSARLPVPRIDLDSATDRAVPLQAAAVTAETGYEVLAFDTTMEQGIPCVWTMAVAPGDTGPKMVCTAGSHLSLEQATLNALSELGPLLGDLLDRFPGEADRARQMAGDPGLVTTMHDHSTLYGLPEVFDRLAFLTAGTGRRAFPDTAAASDRPFGNDDLSDDLREVIDRFLSTGLDVVVVDQTTTEHRAAGFACVKVLVPGSVPMTFGHQHRRTVGLPRLLTTPHTLGYRGAPLAPSELNPHPHPFP